MLRGAGIEYDDTTACLIEAKATDEFTLQSHYSPTANAVIAKCLKPIVRKEISQLKQYSRPSLSHQLAIFPPLDTAMPTIQPKTYADGDWEAHP